MRILYVTGACLLKNTSANMSHNAYLKGLLDNQAEVDVVMASDSWGEPDAKFERFEGAQYYLYNAVSIKDKLRRLAHHIADRGGNRTASSTQEPSDNDAVHNISGCLYVRSLVKKVYSFMLRQDRIYPLNKKWLSEASHFRSPVEYDLVVSNSSPAASHKLVSMLTKKKRIRFKRWIQIWEDPWHYDLYGGNSEEILQEEHRLLQDAQEVYYVSPLTLMYQKRYFPDCADKMKVIPLPYFVFSEDNHLVEQDAMSFGYFGDYYSHVRNLLPFYEALKESGVKGYIYGDSNMRLKPTDSIQVSGRVTLNVLEAIQQKTRVLVHLCNLRGGQIPGKIYHYSATKKPILFIVDGTDEEKTVIKNYFSKYQRYFFCENTSESILSAMQSIVARIDSLDLSPVEAFSPKSVVKQLL